MTLITLIFIGHPSAPGSTSGPCSVVAYVPACQPGAVEPLRARLPSRGGGQRRRCVLARSGAAEALYQGGGSGVFCHRCRSGRGGDGMDAWWSTAGALAWREANECQMTMLRALQANILKPHVRDHLLVLFLRFESADAASTCLHAFGRHVKGAFKQLQEAHAFRSEGRPGTSYVGLGLTSSCYDLLGIPPESRPDDPSFRQ